MSNNDTNVMNEIPAPSAEYIAKAEAKSLEFMNPKRWQVMEFMAKTFVNSGALPKSIDSAAKLIMVFQAGYEAGLQPLEALNSFYFVNGKLSMYGDTVISQVKKAGHKISWGDCNDKSATVTIERGDTGEKMTSTFTMEMAKERGYTSNPIYLKYPENMLKFRAFGMTAKFIVPDALHGIPIKEDLEGEVVEVTPVSPKAEAKKGAKKATTADVPTHQSLEEALEQPEKPEEEIKDEK